MKLFRLAYAAVGPRVRWPLNKLVGAREKLGCLLIGVAPDRNLASRDQVTDRLVGSMRMKEMAPQQRADVFRMRMLLDPGADGIVKLTAFGEGHRTKRRPSRPCLNTNSPGARSDGSMTPNPVKGGDCPHLYRR